MPPGGVPPFVDVVASHSGPEMASYLASGGVGGIPSGCSQQRPGSLRDHASRPRSIPSILPIPQSFFLLLSLSRFTELGRGALLATRVGRIRRLADPLSCSSELRCSRACLPSRADGHRADRRRTSPGSRGSG